MKDFFEESRKKGYHNDYYPYSKIGVGILRITRTMFTWLISLIVIAVVLFVISMVTQKAITLEEIAMIESIIDRYLEYTMYYLSMGIDWLFKSCIAAISTLIIIFAILFFIYVISMFFRWRNWERDVLKNDIMALQLRNVLISSLGVSQKIRDANHTSENAKHENYNQETTKGGLYAVKHKLKVYVNTRQSTDGDDIIRQYRIIIPIPYDIYEEEVLNKTLAKLKEVAIRFTKGTVSFGDMEKSVDRSTYTSRGMLIVKDKYDYSHLKVKEIDNTVYETSYPLALFPNNETTIARIRLSAEQWVSKTARIVDTYFSSGKISANRIGLEVGNTTALYIYDTPFTLDIPYLDKAPKTFDSLFQTTGCMVTIVEGRIQVVIPLPDKYKVPMDMRSIYMEAFGGNDEQYKDFQIETT